MNDMVSLAISFSFEKRGVLRKIRNQLIASFFVAQLNFSTTTKLCNQKLYYVVYLTFLSFWSFLLLIFILKWIRFIKKRTSFLECRCRILIACSFTFYPLSYSSISFLTVSHYETLFLYFFILFWFGFFWGEAHKAHTKDKVEERERTIFIYEILPSSTDPSNLFLSFYYVVNNPSFIFRGE
jgi:hypothetical protein